MIFCGILALSIIIANLTIIIVILRNYHFPTSQLIYKLSLAFADILVGIFVVPSFISTLYIIYISPLQKKSSSEDNSWDPNKNLTGLDEKTDFYFTPKITQAYVNFFGFITFLSLFNSTFTLMFASIDRYKVLSKPLRYDKHKAAISAKRVTMALWFLSVIFSLSPIVVPKMGLYCILAGGILISVCTEISFFILGTTLAIPFFVMWLFTIALQVQLKRQHRQSSNKNLRSTRYIRNFNTEKSIAKTLSIIIGVYTACVFPALLFVIFSEFIPSVNPLNLKSFSIRLAAVFSSIELFVTVILVSNSLWNAFIYAFRHKTFRKDAAVLYYSIFFKFKKTG